MVHCGLGLKAATVTPPGIGDVGSPNRILREGVGGSVIVRTGRRIPGVTPLAAVVHPIVVVRLAVGDAYGADEGRTGPAGSPSETVFRTEHIERSACRAVADYSFVTAASLEGCVYGGPKWTVSPAYEGILKEEMDAAAARHPGVPYLPVLIDASYAGLLTDTMSPPRVIPALNRDGDCLSDLVLAMFGSIAGAESVLLALDDDLAPRVAMAEAPHGTAPSLEGKNVANPMAMLLACAAVLEHAGRRGYDDASRAAFGFETRPSAPPPTESGRWTSEATPQRPTSWTKSCLASAAVVRRPHLRPRAHRADARWLPDESVPLMEPHQRGGPRRGVPPRRLHRTSVTALLPATVSQDRSRRAAARRPPVPAAAPCGSVCSCSSPGWSVRRSSAPLASWSRSSPRSA